jgi:hypothetical protein
MGWAPQAQAQELGGVSCQDVKDFALAQDNPTNANECPGILGSTSGCSALPGLALPPRGGFDYVDGWVMLRATGSCPTELDELFICIEVAGKPGDADGDGVLNNSAPSACSYPLDITDDGDDSDSSFPLRTGESYILQIDRDCSTADPATGSFGADLGLRLQGPSIAGAFPKLIVDFDLWAPANNGLERSGRNSGPHPDSYSRLGGLL